MSPSQPRRASQLASIGLTGAPRDRQEDRPADQNTPETQAASAAETAPAPPEGDPLGTGAAVLTEPHSPPAVEEGSSRASTPTPGPTPAPASGRRPARKRAQAPTRKRTRADARTGTRPDGQTPAATDTRTDTRTGVHPDTATPGGPDARTRVHAREDAWRRVIDVEGRRYAAVARKLTERETELGRAVADAVSGGVAPERVRSWLEGLLPKEAADRLTSSG